MAIDFNNALNTAVSSIERPPLAPVGHYVWQITKPAVMEKRGKDDAFEVVEFPLTAASVYEQTDDVNADDLAAYGKVTNIRDRLTFMFDLNDETKFQQTMFRLRTFLTDHLKIDMDDSVTLKQGIALATNKRFVAPLSYRPDKENPEIQYTNIGKTSAFE